MCSAGKRGWASLLFVRQDLVAAAVTEDDGDSDAGGEPEEKPETAVVAEPVKKQSLAVKSAVVKGKAKVEQRSVARTGKAATATRKTVPVKTERKHAPAADSNAVGVIAPKTQTRMKIVGKTSERKAEILAEEQFAP